MHLCCSNYGELWRSLGNGTFAVSVIQLPGFTPPIGQWRTGDFNGDGKTDLIHFSGATSASVWKSNVTSTSNAFAGPLTFPAPGGYPMWAGKWRSGDFNADGRTDLLHVCCSSNVNVWFGQLASPYFNANPGLYSFPGLQDGSWVESEFTSDNDGDGWLNGLDNCPDWPNAAQNIPTWADDGSPPLPADDRDCDSFPASFFTAGRAAESFLGTNPKVQCAQTVTPNDESGPDAWPMDFNDDRNPNSIDVGGYVTRLNATPGPGSPYETRYDLNQNNVINTADVGFFPAVVNDPCTP